MTKEEKIKEAYGFINEWICGNGWASYFADEGWEGGVEPFGEYDIRNKTDDYFEWRPKSLQGIEDNNGWIKIESEEDLPEKGIDCHFILKSGVTGIFTNLDDSEYLTLKNRATHYQPIQKPKPPIY